MTIASKNFFEIFSLPESFELDLVQLADEYKKLLAQVHPDKFSDADDTTKLQALQMSAYINDAYSALKDPLKRAAYILTLNGVDPHEHNQQHLSESLLLQQMDWRDQLDIATEEEDLNTIERLKHEVTEEHESCLNEFQDYVNAFNFVDAKPVYNKMQFIEKMLSEIDSAEEKILDY